MSGSLAGRRVIVTRERPGALGAILTGRGATVVHVPLIAVVEAADGGEALRTELDRLGTYDWLVVTSVPGAERAATAAAAHPDVRLAAVGTTTAATVARLAGRDVDVVPAVQRATALADALCAAATGRQRILVAQADRAGQSLVDGLRAGGHDVTAVVAYRTTDVAGDPAAIDGADAVVFASGSSIESWVAAFGTRRPPVAVGIGPSTAAAAARTGLKLDGVAADHSLDGLVTELERHLDDAAGHGS